MTERGLTNHDHPIEHLLFDRAHKPFAVRVHIRTPGWHDERFYTAALEQAIEHLGECGVPIMDEIAFPKEEPVARIGQLPRTLLHEGGRGVRGDAGDLDTPCGQLYDHEDIVRDEAVP